MPSAVTVAPEQRDVYRTRNLDGVIQTREPKSAKSGVAGRFLPDRESVAGQWVAKGERLGAIKVCPKQPPQASPSAQPDPAEPPPTITEAAECPNQSYRLVHAPVTGQLATVATEGDVERGATVASVKQAGHVMVASITDAETIYDLRHPAKTARGLIVGGRAGFIMTFEQRRYSPEDKSVTMVLGVPEDVDVVEGLRARAVFVIARKDNVLTLPLAAVRGEAQTGEVVTVGANGAHKVVKVNLGQRDSKGIEVEGIDADTRVLAYPLESDFQRADR